MQQLNKFLFLAGAMLGAASVFNTALAQGQDSTTADRDIMIIDQMLPGFYSNANQAYFDYRLKVDEQARHASASWQVSKIDDRRLTKKFGAYVYALEEVFGPDRAERFALLSFSVDYDENAVRMKTVPLSKKFDANKISLSKLAAASGCDLLWSQEAGQFRARAANQTCAQEDRIARDMMLSPDALWASFNAAGAAEAADHFAMDRARNFQCYADLPGVGGGRDIPFERYQVNDVHDLGGEKWFTTKEGQHIGINLFRVMWSFNNYEGVFTRPSFVAYIKTKETEDGEAKEISYAWTEPAAQRIGINLKWMLVNCYMISNEDVVPFFKTNEPKL